MAMPYDPRRESDRDRGGEGWDNSSVNRYGFVATSEAKKTENFHEEPFLFRISNVN